MISHLARTTIIITPQTCISRIIARNRISIFNTHFLNSISKSMAVSDISSDKSLGPIFFWREFEEPFGFLSQWYDCKFEVDGVTYASTEMWMMVQKARLFGDEVLVMWTIQFVRVS